MRRIVNLFLAITLGAVGAVAQSANVAFKMRAAYDSFCNGDEAGVINSIKEISEDEILTLPDSLRYCFYYCNAGLMSSQDNSDRVKLLDYINKALSLREKSLGIRNSEYLELLWAKGSELEDSDQAAATKAYQRAIVIGKDLLANEDSAINHWFGRILSDLGALYQKRGYTDQAISLYREGFQRLSPSYVKDEDSSAWISLFSLQLLYFNQGNYTKAIEIDDELLKFFADNDAKPSHDYAQMLYFKGNALSKIEQYVEATKCYTEGIEMLKAYDTYDSELESLYGNLYGILLSAGRIAEAENLTPTIIDYLTHIGKSEHIYNYYFTGANQLLSAGKYEAAENLAVRCEPFLEKSSPIAQVQILNTIAVSRLKQNNGEGALEPLERIKSICLEQNATDTEIYTVNQHNLGRAYMLVGDKEKAISYLKSSIDLQKKLNIEEIETTRCYLNELEKTE